MEKEIRPGCKSPGTFLQLNTHTHTTPRASGARRMQMNEGILEKAAAAAEKAAAAADKALAGLKKAQRELEQALEDRDKASADLDKAALACYQAEGR